MLEIKTLTFQTYKMYEKKKKHSRYLRCAGCIFQYLDFCIQILIAHTYNAFKQKQKNKSYPDFNSRIDCSQKKCMKNQRKKAHMRF